MSISINYIRQAQQAVRKTNVMLAFIGYGSDNRQFNRLGRHSETSNILWRRYPLIYESTTKGQNLKTRPFRTKMRFLDIRGIRGYWHREGSGFQAEIKPQFCWQAEQPQGLNSMLLHPFLIFTCSCGYAVPPVTWCWSMPFIDSWLLMNSARGCTASRLIQFTDTLLLLNTVYCYRVVN